MSRRAMFTSIFLYVILLLAHTALGRHAHRRPLHRHAARADSTTNVTPTTAATLPSFTAGDAVIDDIEKIQAGLTGLPDDLLAFILALEKRLKEVENLLAGYINNSDGSSVSPVGPVGPVLFPAPSEVTQATTDDPTLDVSTTSLPSSSASISMCRPLGGAGPLRPCDEPDDATTTRTTRITRTMTSRITTTQEIVMSTGVISNNTLPAVNATGFEPPAPWTKPYHISTTSAADFTITYTFAEPTIPSLETSTDTPTLASATETSETRPSSYPTPPNYVFDAASEDNVAVYYGTTPATETGGLALLCANPNVDIVILSFLFSFYDAGGYPSIDFGPGCSDPTSAQASIAPGLKDCSTLAQEIATCQSIGKKVLISLGGYNSNTSFASDEQAAQFATTIWDLFGAGTTSQTDASLRPFGPDVKIDGFDIDNENHSTDHYEAFATTLREKFTSDPSKTYYLSAAPQCPIPDESIPLGALLQADFVWVQFYNNPSCNIDSVGFQESFREWSKLLSGGGANAGPRLYIGAAGFEGAGSGYVKGSGLGTRVRTARGLYVDNLGGVMLWDGSEGVANVDQDGVDYLEYAKASLH
ncbi:hypothetical protein Q7P37_004757 [Cladosporium fusiforme]